MSININTEIQTVPEICTISYDLLVHTLNMCGMSININTEIQTVPEICTISYDSSANITY